jgi:acyl-CoA synthetase (AMP-forming)/AMP-acid ligase II
VLAETQTVGRLLRRQAALRGTHPLLVCDADRISYADAERRSADLARGLMALGAGKGSHVGLLYPNGTEWLIAMLAAARIGAVVVPFSTFATSSEMTTQLAHADIEILLATASYRNHDYRERLAAVERSAVPLLRHVLIDAELHDMADDASLEAMEDDVDPSDTLAIVYTSGSTAAPKGVVHTHSSLLEHQRVLNEIRGLTPTTGCSAIRRSSGSAVSRSRSWRPCSPAPPSSAPTLSTRAKPSTCWKPKSRP